MLLGSVAYPKLTKDKAIFFLKHFVPAPLKEIRSLFVLFLHVATGLFHNNKLLLSIFVYYNDKRKVLVRLLIE